ncbi:S1C family serine protease [Dactylosporangium sp. NPDC048998]|uniref:S1C family serine protease n=1 Tax=Dactylosporangium sp. NPDC048998 TaxID=3363976 RepID=UPI00371955B8
MAVTPGEVTPVTAPVGGLDRYGPQRWGGGPVPYPKPPEWRGPPRRRGWLVLRWIVGSIVLVTLASLVGVAGLVAAVQSQSQPPGPRPPTGAQPNAAPPALFSDAPSDPPSAAAPAPTEAPDPAAIVSSVNRSVVDINATLGLRNARAAGTGIVLTGTGLVLTNNHVIAGATSITGTAVANGRTFHAGVVGYDRSHDIAVIQLANATGLPRLAVADSSSVGVGDPIIAIGNAGGAGGTPTAVTGSVTALDQSITAQEPDGGGAQQLYGLIQVAADIRSGDSGGPLVDRSGRLIGINTAASVEEQGQAAGGTGFAIPSNTAVGIAQQIQAGKASPTIHLGPTALLGVAAADAEGQVGGAAVTGVIVDSPAERAGLNAGDVIRSVDGQPVGSARALTSVLDTHHPGDQVRIAWVDQSGQSHAATVRLAVGPAG